MKINWQIPVMIIMILFAGCSKDKEIMNGELIIEDLKVGMKISVSGLQEGEQGRHSIQVLE